MDLRMIIRKFRPEDKKPFCMLSDQINHEHYENMPNDFKEPIGNEGDWEHWCAFDKDERGILLVAEDGDVADGFIAGRVVDSGKSSYLVPKKKLQISTIVVEQSAQGQGIGRALVESAVLKKFAKERLCPISRILESFLLQSALVF